MCDLLTKKDKVGLKQTYFVNLCNEGPRLATFNQARGFKKRLIKREEPT